MSITLTSSRFGDVEIDASAVIEFPDGLIGLGGAHYALLATSEETPFLWLHSLDDGGLALPVTNPHAFFPEFRLEMLKEDADRFKIDERVSVDVYVTIRAISKATATTPASFVANQRAPIVIHGGRGAQIINQAPGMELRAPLPVLSAAKVTPQREVVKPAA
jgi:flagellar assembly factor FliW